MKKYNSTELIENAKEAYKRIDKQYGFEECSFLEGYYQGYAASVVNESNDIQNVSGCFSAGFIEDKGCCDGDCDAVEWIGDTCKYKNECKLGCGTVWIKPNNR